MEIAAISFSVAVTALVGFLLSEVFRSLDPARIGQYRPCAGGWHEAYLHDCQLGLKRLPQQPVNTYTNLAYLAGGSFLALSLDTPPAYVLGLTSLYLCVGSALYHGMSTRWAGSLDVSAMYALFTALAAYALCQLLGVGTTTTAAIMLGAAVVLGYVLRYWFRGDMQLKIGIFLGVALVAVIVKTIRGQQSEVWPWVISSLALFGLAFFIWNLDKKKIFPLKHWGHGFWHLLTAGAICALFYGTYLTA